MLQAASSNRGPEVWLQAEPAVKVSLDPQIVPNFEGAKKSEAACCGSYSRSQKVGI